MRKIITVVLALSLLVGPTLYAEVDQALSSRLMRSVALLYSQDESGSMQMRCTATAFDKTHKGYLFASAAHCVGEDQVQKERSADAANIAFFVTFDEKNPKVFYAAEVKGVGYQHRGDDFSIFEVESKQDWPMVPVGDESKIDVSDPKSSSILNVASPLGLGKQMFHGYVSSTFLDRPIIEGDINWRGSMMLQISAGPGSSGSAIVSEQQAAIVGFLVGTVGGTNVIAVPVSKFKKFKKGVEDNTYKWYHPDKE